jgi:hypothetical protein
VQKKQAEEAAKAAAEQQNGEQPASPVQ